MSKSYRLAPHQWRKAVQRYCHFWNWQIFLQLFFIGVINNFAKNHHNKLLFNKIRKIIFLKKFPFFLWQAIFGQFLAKIAFLDILKNRTKKGVKTDPL